jgi:hypothetical protein
MAAATAMATATATATAMARNNGGEYNNDSKDDEYTTINQKRQPKE